MTLTQILLTVIPCSFHSCQKPSSGEHRGISESHSDDQVIHGSAGIDINEQKFRVNGMPNCHAIQINASHFRLTHQPFELL